MRRRLSGSDPELCLFQGQISEVAALEDGAPLLLTSVSSWPVEALSGWFCMPSLCLGLSGGAWWLWVLGSAVGVLFRLVCSGGVPGG
ncbi:unnamed protein product [Brassica oleracea]